jgi:hypothetical protein
MFKKMQMLALTATLAPSIVAGLSSAKSEGLIVGLVDLKSIVTIDPIARKVVSQHTIRGVDTRIVGFDVRPTDGLLYGVASNGEIYAFDLKSGQAGQGTKKSKLSAPWKSGVTTTIDFNPVTDLMRVMGSHGVSVTVNVNDGKVTIDGGHKYKEGDVNAAKTPKIIAGAHTNAKRGSQTTTLYAIDASTRALVTQEPPNDGLLTTVGLLGVTLAEPVAFKIATKGERNEAMLTSNGVLYSVDLATGKATLVGKIEGLSGKLLDIGWID